MPRQELFNPKYPKKVKDLPEEEQRNFTDVKEGGFVRKEADEELSDAKLTAEIANISKLAADDKMYMKGEGKSVKKTKDMSSMDVLHERANAMDSRRETCLENIKRGSISLPDIPKEFIDDEGVMLEAISRNSYALEFASEELRADKKVVLEAVKNEPDAIMYASQDIKEEIENLLKK